MGIHRTEEAPEPPHWLTVCFLVGLAPLVTIYKPAVGMVCALVAGFALARRATARDLAPNWLTVKDIWSVIGTIRRGHTVTLMAVAMPLSTAVVSLPWFLGQVQMGLALVGPLAVMAILRTGAVRHGRRVRTQLAYRQQIASDLASVFTVKAQVMDQAVITRLDDGAVRIGNVHADILKKLTRANRAALDAAMADVMPTWMLAPSSSERVVFLVPVDEATAVRRSALAASGGLLAGPESPDSGGVPAGGWRRRDLDLSNEVF